MSKKVIQIIGWVGIFLVLLAYFLVTFGFITVNMIIYPTLNIIGSLGIVIETFSKKDYQPTVLNIIWILIAFVAIIKLVY